MRRLGTHMAPARCTDTRSACSCSCTDPRSTPRHSTRSCRSDLRPRTGQRQCRLLMICTAPNNGPSGLDSAALTLCVIDARSDSMPLFGILGVGGLQLSQCRHRDRRGVSAHSILWGPHRDCRRRCCCPRNSICRRSSPQFHEGLRTATVLRQTRLTRGIHDRHRKYGRTCCTSQSQLELHLPSPTGHRF